MYIMGTCESIIGGILGLGCCIAAAIENGGDCSSSSSSANLEKTHREQDEIRENIRNNDYNQRMHNMFQEHHIERMQIANVPGY